MRAKTTEGRKLRRAANDYAAACVELSWLGSRDAEEHEAINLRHQKARERLYKLIDELTTLDLTPRAVSDGY